MFKQWMAQLWVSTSESSKGLGIMGLSRIFCDPHHYLSIAPDDYLPISANITFEPFQVAISLPITIINDQITEGEEQFTITLISYEEEVSIRGDLVITITDGGGKKITFSILIVVELWLLPNADVLFGFSNTSVSVVEGEGVVSVDIGIRGGAVTEPFQVQVFTSDGSAEGM